MLTLGVLISALLYCSAAMARLARRRARAFAKKSDDFQTLLEVLPVGIAVADDARMPPHLDEPRPGGDVAAPARAAFHGRL